MYEKIIDDLMIAADDISCRDCPIYGCPKTIETCLFHIAAKAMKSLEEENITLRKQVADVEVRQMRDIAKLVEINVCLEKELTEFRSFIRELSGTNSQKEDE